MVENDNATANTSNQDLQDASAPAVNDPDTEAAPAEQDIQGTVDEANDIDADLQLHAEALNDQVVDEPSGAAEELLQEAEIALETEQQVGEAQNGELGTAQEQPQLGEYEEVGTEEAEELPLEPEEFEEIPEKVDEQAYEEEQQLDEYGLEYGHEYGQDEQDYGYDVEDAEHGHFEPDFDQLAENEEDHADTVADGTVPDGAAAEQAEGKAIGDSAAAAPSDDAQEDDGANAQTHGDDASGATVLENSLAAAENGTKQEDSKRKHRPISWNDWKGVDDTPKQSDGKAPASDKPEAAKGDKPAPKENAASTDGKSAKKRSRSRSPGKPCSSSQANGPKEGRSSSRGRSAERDKERSKSADRSNPAKKQQTETGRSDARRTSSPPRRSQLMGPGPVIRGRLVRGPAAPHPLVAPAGRLIAVRRPVAAGPALPIGRRQSPPPGFLGRGLVPIMPLRAAPLRTGLQPGEVLIPQLAPRRASFPPGRAPTPLEARFLGPPSIASDMAAVRLAGPRDVQIVHVPREQLRTLRPVRDLREAEAVRAAPPGIMKAPVGMRPGGPVLARPGRESVAVLREPARDLGPSRGGPVVGPRDDFRMPVPPEMHGRLQGSVRQSPPRDDRAPVRSVSAPIHAPRGLDDGRHRPGSTLVPSRRPPSPHRLGPPSRHSPPRPAPAPSASLRRPAEPLNRPHSPPSKRSRHEPVPSSGPQRHPPGLPGPPVGPMSPRGLHPPNSAQRPSASLPSQRGGPVGPSSNGRIMSSVQVAPPRMPGPPPPRNAPLHVGRDDGRGRPGDDRGRMQPGSASRPRSPPRRDDRREHERREAERREQERREQERQANIRRESERREHERREAARREQERREQERREQERREQERRASSQRQASSSRSAVPSSRDSRRMHAQHDTGSGRSAPGAGGRVGTVPGGGMGGASANAGGMGGGNVGGVGMGGVGVNAAGMGAAGVSVGGMGAGGVSGWSQAPAMMAQQGAVVQQQGGQMMQQQLPGPPTQQQLPRPQVQPVAQQQQLGVMQPGMGMQGMGMQAAAAANGNGLMAGSMNWNNASNAQPTAAAPIPAPYAHLGSAVQQPLAPLNSTTNNTNMGGSMGNMGGQHGQHGRTRVDENENCWYYIDPQNQQQGPCSINQFRKWLSYLETESKYEREYQQFKSVMVWKEGSTAQTPLWSLLQL